MTQFNPPWNQNSGVPNNTIRGPQFNLSGANPLTSGQMPAESSQGGSLDPWKLIKSLIQPEDIVLEDVEKALIKAAREGDKDTVVAIKWKLRNSIQLDKDGAPVSAGDVMALAFLRDTVPDYEKLADKNDKGPGGMSAYESGSLDLARQRAELDRQQERRALQEALASLEIKKVQMEQEAAEGRAGALAKLGPQSLPSGTEFIPGFGPGEGAEGISRMLRRPFTPTRANTTPFDLNQFNVSPEQRQKIDEAIRRLGQLAGQ